MCFSSELAVLFGCGFKFLEFPGNSNSFPHGFISLSDWPFPNGPCDDGRVHGGCVHGHDGD